MKLNLHKDEYYLMLFYPCIRLYPTAIDTLAAFLVMVFVDNSSQGTELLIINDRLLIISGTDCWPLFSDLQSVIGMQWTTKNMRSIHTLWSFNACYTKWGWNILLWQMSKLAIDTNKVIGAYEGSILASLSVSLLYSNPMIMLTTYWILTWSKASYI